MAVLHPFRAVRPLPEYAEEVASVPYDVITADEARLLAEGKPRSFLHVIRPEIDLEDGIDEHDDRVYAQGAANMRSFVGASYTEQDEEATVYVYRLVMDGRPQTGIFAGVAVSDYDNNTILKHEKTRPSKEDDRTRHILEQRAHAEPVMLTYRDDDQVAEITEEVVGTVPLYDFDAPDGVHHTVWRVSDPSQLVRAFAAIPKLYVADGHHRCKAASRARERLGSNRDSEEVSFFPAVLFPMGNMAILPYNRVIKKLPVGAPEFYKRLARGLELSNDGEAVPAEKGSIAVFLDGRWSMFRLPEQTSGQVADRLDVARLAQHVLDPMLGIVDQRRDPNIDFVGGIRGVGELERLVSSGRAEMAISMYPTTIEELLAVSDAGELMPPKSTWFEPKLRSGLLVHLF